MADRGHSKTLCVAHRGNSSEELENSMAALISAKKLKSPAIEFDIHHTKDGQAIVMHDPTLKRTAKSKRGGECPLNVKIKNLTLSKIQSECRLKNGEDIPTLEEVLQYFHRSRMILLVELKDSPNIETLELLQKYYRQNPEKIRLISFKESALNKTRKNIAKGMLKNGTKLFHISSKPSKVSFSYDGVAVRKPSATFIRKAQKNKKLISVWTINSKREMKKYSRLGVDFLTTNKPRVCVGLI